MPGGWEGGRIFGQELAGPPAPIHTAARLTRNVPPRHQSAWSPLHDSIDPI